MMTEQTIHSTNFGFNFTDSDDSEITCPPLDIYTLEITKVHPFEQRPGYKPPNPSEDFEETTETQTRIDFTIVDYDYDPNTDERDWNGVTITDFFTWGRLYHNSGRETQVWKADGSRGRQSKSNSLTQAALGGPWKPGMTFDPHGWEGKRIRAQIKANAKGYPRTENHMPARRGAAPRPAAPQQQEAPAPQQEAAAPPATMVQLAKIMKAWEDKGLGDTDALEAYVSGTWNNPLDNLTREEATEVLQAIDSQEVPF